MPVAAVTADNGLYRPVDAAVIRVAASIPELGRLALPDLAEGARQAEAWREWLRAAWACERFAAAVALASPSLASQVERICTDDDVPPRQVRRAVFSVLRYLLRGTSRATPFGLFAGVAPIRFGRTAAFDGGGPGRALGRVDAAWLDGVLTRLERCEGLFPRLPVVVNNLAFVVDGRLTLDHRRPATGAAPGTAAEVSVRLTRPVENVLKTAARPTPMTDLLSTLAEQFPATPATVISQMVSELMGRGLLRSGLRPPATVTDPLGHVVAVLDAAGAGTVPEAATLLAELRTLHRDLAKYGPDVSTSSGPARRTATAATRPDLPALRRLSVDLHAHCVVELPVTVAREAAAAAGLLARLCPEPGGPPAWRDYHARFVEKYGVGGLVPLKELVYAESGLGFPAGYRGTRLAPPPARGLSPRDELLLDLAQTVAATGSREIVLDGTLLADLSADVHMVQPHTELRFRLHARSLAAADGGEFRLAVAGVSRAAGTTSGRFLDLFDDADRDRMLAAHQHLPTLTEGAIVAQLSGGTLSTAAENVSRTPRILRHLIALGEHHPPGDEGLIDLADLAVTGDADHLWLVSLSHGRPVEPIACHAVELTRSAHPLLRFLSEIATARAATCAPFSWGAASRLPYLPRLRHGRTILTPARWLLPAAALPAAHADFPTWTAGLATWRERCGIPDVVFVGEDDRRLRLDLTEPAHQHLLRADLDQAGRATLREAPPDDGAGWCDGRITEIVVPLVATNPARQPRPRVTAGGLARIEDGHLPGQGDWLYAKLYAQPDRQTAILSRHLPDLFSRWPAEPQWWFLRYQDPDPHLRLRIRLPYPTYFAAAAANVGGWARRLRDVGLLDTVQFDTYLPETGRFGPGAAMTAAEAVFAADSAAAIAQLAATGRSGTRLRALAAVSYLDIAAGCLPDLAAAARWLADRLPRASGPALDRELRAEAIRLARPGDDWPGMWALPGCEQVVDAWERRRTALAAYKATLATANHAPPAAMLPALLHLHQARLTGTNPDIEAQCARLARAVALSILHRTGRNP